MKLNASTPDEFEIYDKKYDEYSKKLDKVNFELNKLQIKEIQDDTVKRFDAIKRKLKEFQKGEIDIDGELIHAVINKILVQDEHTIVYLIPKNRPHSNEEIKQFRYRYMNSKVILSGHKESKRNKKFYYIDYKVVLV